jgi:PAS domain S-box-containing protein
MAFPKVNATSSSASSSIKSYIYLLIGTALIMSAVVIGYLYWQTAVSRRTEELSSQYHLMTILNVAQAEESLRHVMTHRTYARLSLYEPGHNLDIDNASAYSPNTDISLIKSQLEDIVALQRTYAYPEFDESVQNVTKYLEQLQSIKDDPNPDAENAFPTDEEAAQFLTTLEQLQQLHTIVREEMLAEQSIQTEQNNRNMFILLGGVLLVGLVISYRILDSISHILAQQKQDKAKVRQRNEELATFNSIAAAVNQLSELDIVLPTALIKIEKALGLKHSEIWLLDEENGRLLPSVHHGLADDFALELPFFKIGVGLPGIIAQTDRPLLIEDLATDPRFLRERGQRYNLGSALGIPLMFHERVVGIMNFFAQKPDLFTPQLIAFLATTGYMLGAAIENSRLFTTVHKELTARVQAEEGQLAHLWRLENIDRIDRAIQQSSDLEQMMANALETILDIFQCDRAWLLYPCDLDAPSWQVPMECTRAEYPGALALGEDVPMSPDVAELFQMALDSARPLCYDPQTGRPLPEPAVRFSVQSQMITAVYPKADKPWLLGIHQCSRARVWTENEQKLFEEIGYRITDALSSLLFLRDLQESEARYRLLFENAPAGIVSTDTEGNILDANPATIKMVGSPSVEATKQINFLTFPLLVEAGLSGDLQHCMEAGETMAAERFYTSKWGRNVWFRYQMTPIRDVEHQIVGAQIILEDVTKRKKAEAEISQLAVVIEQASDAIYITDLDGSISYANLAAETMSGYSVAELLGQNPRLFQSGRHDQAFYEHIWQTISSGKSWRGEFINKHKNGNIYYEEATIFPIKDKAGQIINYAAVKRDITQEKEREQRAREQDRLAAVGQLAAGVAHDFNNIMAVIVLYSQLTLRGDDLSEKMRQRMQTIEKQALRASDLTQQILDFSRQAVLDRQPMPLVPFLKELFNLLERTLPENINLNLSFGKDEYIIYADPTRIQQVIMNLALNARDAMLDGGEFRTVLEQINVAEGGKRPFPDLTPGDWIQITISDGGTGIPTDVLQHVFDPFFTTKAPGKGSGLGLAQVHGIIKQHEGHVDVTTKMDQGTTFMLYFPALPQSMLEKSSPETMSDLHQGNGETILVVEDYLVVRDALVAMLELFNYRVLTAVNGRDGLALYHQHKDNIILLISDAIMPVMGGIELLHTLRQAGDTIPIIILSGHPKQASVDLLPEQGYAEWLPKPAQLPQLTQAINRALQYHSKQRNER